MAQTNKVFLCTETLCMAGAQPTDGFTHDAISGGWMRLDFEIERLWFLRVGDVTLTPDRVDGEQSFAAMMKARGIDLTFVNDLQEAREEYFHGR